MDDVEGDMDVGDIFYVGLGSLSIGDL